MTDVVDSSPTFKRCLTLYEIVIFQGLSIFRHEMGVSLPPSRGCCKAKDDQNTWFSLTWWCLWSALRYGKSAMYLLGLEVTCFSVKWGEYLSGGEGGMPAAAGPSSLENRVFLREGKKPSIRSGQCRGNFRGLRLRAPPSGRSWQVGSSWTLTPPTKAPSLPPPPALSSQLGRGWSDNAVLLGRPSFPHLYFNICFPVLWKIENLSTISPLPASLPASPLLLTASHLFLKGIM